MSYRLRVAVLLILVLAGFAQAALAGVAQGALPPIRVGSIADSRFNDSWTLDGDEMQNTRAKLLNPANFGPAGTVPRSIVITDTAAPITAELLAQFDVFFIGYLRDDRPVAFTGGELNAFAEWVSAGGVMVITCDEAGYDAVCAFFGYPSTPDEDGPSTNPIAPTNVGAVHPMFHGPFGTVAAMNMDGTQGAFTSTTGAVVLARESSPAKLPCVLVKSVGGGTLILMSDVDLLANAASPGDGINNANDRFVGNVFAFAGAPTLPPIRVGSIADSRFTDKWTLDGVNMQNTRAKLLNPANFGPAGRAGRRIVITDTADPITPELLAQFDVFFIGYLRDNRPEAFTPDELNAFANWASAGGTMIITCDNSGHDAVCSFFGYPANGSSQNPILPTEAGIVHPLFSGPFGVVAQLQMVGTQGAFGSTTGASVLAVDSSDQKLPGVLFRSYGAGRLILLADVDIVANALSGGNVPEEIDAKGITVDDGIENDNDRFLGNLFAFAGGVPFNYTGLWWNRPAFSESGWGFNATHQGNTIFITWFTYDFDGKPWWLAATTELQSPGVYQGDLFTTTGPPFNAVPWNPATVVETTVGTATLTFTDYFNGTFAYTIVTPSPVGAAKGPPSKGAAVAQVKQITRQLFAEPVPNCTWAAQGNLSLAANYQGLWWKEPASSESGWGINFTHQADLIFGTWFTYDTNGKPWWLGVVAAKTSGGTYTGDLFTTTGPPFNAVPFPPAVETTVGTATFTFTDGNTVQFDYTVNGVTQSKPLTRQVFAKPGTICSTGQLLLIVK